MNAFFYGSQQNASIFAEFSLPRSGENCRGYVAYEIKAKESDWWIDSWLNYTHQKTIWQYPVISAAQNRRQGGWLDERVFSTVQDALQVLPEGENEGSIADSINIPITFIRFVPKFFRLLFFSSVLCYKIS